MALSKAIPAVTNQGRRLIAAMMLNISIVFVRSSADPKELARAFRA